MPSSVSLRTLSAIPCAPPDCAANDSALDKILEERVQRKFESIAHLITMNTPARELPDYGYTQGPPNWDDWSVIPEATIQEAVLLSCNLAPGPFGSIFRQLGAQLPKIPEHCRRRMYLTAQNVGPRKAIRRLRRAPSTDDWVINIKQFGEWARSVGWALPKEFLSMLPPVAGGAHGCATAALAAAAVPAGSVEPEKPLRARERATLHKVIAALLHEAGIGLSERGLPKRVVAMTDIFGHTR